MPRLMLADLKEGMTVYPVWMRGKPYPVQQWMFSILAGVESGWCSEGWVFTTPEEALAHWLPILKQNIVKRRLLGRVIAAESGITWCTIGRNAEKRLRRQGKWEAAEAEMKRKGGTWRNRK